MPDTIADMISRMDTHPAYYIVVLAPGEVDRIAEAVVARLVANYTQPVSTNAVDPTDGSDHEPTPRDSNSSELNALRAACATLAQRWRDRFQNPTFAVEAWGAFAMCADELEQEVAGWADRLHQLSQKS